MRYYAIELINKAGKPLTPPSLGGLPISSLLPGGGSNPTALNIELDVPIAYAAQPAGNAYLRIWGLSVTDLGPSFDLNDAKITVKAGMAKGLPLANPQQAGVIAQGKVYQAFGNWIGTDQTIDVIFYADGGTLNDPKNFSFNWTTGSGLSTAIQSTLAILYPGAKINMSINSQLVLSHDEVGYYGTLSEFSAAVKRLSKSINPTPNYQGVDIFYDGVSFTVTDHTTQPKAKAISFQDLIGQPTWIKSQIIQAKLVMRADLHLGDIVTLPVSLAAQTAASQPRFNNPSNKLTFNGTYEIVGLHHYGNFRQQDAASWATVVDMTPVNP